MRIPASVSIAMSLALMALACGGGAKNAGNADDNCPRGTKWDGENCVARAVVCPGGGKWNGTACVADSGDTTPATTDPGGSDEPAERPAKKIGGGGGGGAGFWCFHSVYDGMAEDECRPTRASCEGRKEKERGFSKTESLGDCYLAKTAYCHNYIRRGDTVWECNKVMEECNIAR